MPPCGRSTQEATSTSSLNKHGIHASFSRSSSAVSDHRVPTRSRHPRKSRSPARTHAKRCPAANETGGGGIVVQKRREPPLRSVAAAIHGSPHIILSSRGPATLGPVKNLTGHGKVHKHYDDEFQRQYYDSESTQGAVTAAAAAVAAKARRASMPSYRAQGADLRPCKTEAMRLLQEETGTQRFHMR